MGNTFPLKKIAVINDKKTGDMAAYKSTLSNVWLPMVESFQRQYGHHMVPVDLRRATYNIRQHLGLPAEDLPPVLVMQRISAARLEPRAPSSVDHLGCELRI